MIYFFCSECREELEAEDSIRGTRMKCPACLKDLEVPKAGSKPAPRPAAGGSRESEAGLEAQPGARFILLVLLLGLVGLLIVGGAGYTLLKRERERKEKARPTCATCGGSGKISCAACEGRKTRACKECVQGKRKNFRDQEEDCYVCSGKATTDCPVCGARGNYGCAACGGTGRLDAPGKK
ncbi:MAG TPA: hypothetical protein VF950_18630 [Planctomycetota bacterium]